MSRTTRSRAWTFVSMGLGVALIAAAAGAWYFLPVRYDAFALLKVSEKRPAVLGKTILASDEFAIFKRTQAQLIRSGAVLQGVLREQDISRLPTIQEHSDDPLSWLRDNLTVDYPDDAEVMRVSLRGENPGDLKTIVDKIVTVYMREIVERERDLRLEHENKLDKSHSQMSNELQQGLGALRQLEAINKTTGSESAKLKRNLAIDELKNMTARRARILEQLDDNALQTIAVQVMRDEATDVRTADPPEGKNSSAGPPLSVLLKQKEHLEEQLKVSDEAIARQTEHIDSLENFSAQVAQKGEDLKALQRITVDLKGELDRVRIERLAPERIVKIDDAAVTNGRGSEITKYVMVSSLALTGLAFVTWGAAFAKLRSIDWDDTIHDAGQA